LIRRHKRYITTGSKVIGNANSRATQLRRQKIAQEAAIASKLRATQRQQQASKSPTAPSGNTTTPTTASPTGTPVRPSQLNQENQENLLESPPPIPLPPLGRPNPFDANHSSNIYEDMSPRTKAAAKAAAIAKKKAEDAAYAQEYAEEPIDLLKFVSHSSSGKITLSKAQFKKINEILDNMHKNVLHYEKENRNLEEENSQLTETVEEQKAKKRSNDNDDGDYEQNNDKYSNPDVPILAKNTHIKSQRKGDLVKQIDLVARNYVFRTHKFLETDEDLATVCKMIVEYLEVVEKVKINMDISRFIEIYGMSVSSALCAARNYVQSELQKAAWGK
jgi:hypothetical protein